MPTEKWSRDYELNHIEEGSCLPEKEEKKWERRMSWQELRSTFPMEKVLAKNLYRHDAKQVIDNKVPNGNIVDHLTTHASLSEDESGHNSSRDMSTCNGKVDGTHQSVTITIPGQSKHRRTKSLSHCEGRNYAISDVGNFHERLAARKPKPLKKPSFLKDFTRKQKVVLSCLCLVEFSSFCSISIMAPFFPKEALAKGMTETTVGFVFSFYALVIFISSPILGRILPHVGAKFLFLSGLFLTSTCNFLFGLLGYIKQQWVFTLYCFAVQGMNALGASAYCTATYVLVAELFSSNIGSVLGIMETFVGLGMSLGPAIGGFFYKIGGFGLPFYSLGSFLLLMVPLGFYLVPLSRASTVKKKPGSLFTILKEPSVIVVGLVVVANSSVWAFLDPTLEPHLRQFDLTSEKIGFIFFLFSALYGLSNLLWGIVSDKTGNHWSMMTSGLLFGTLGLVLLGPAPFITFLKSALWLDVVALSILGVAVALSLLPTFQSLITAVVDAGLGRNDIHTYSIVSGVWSSLYALGEVIGPLIGGFMAEHYGFGFCCTIMAGSTFILAVGSCIYFLTRDCLRNRGRTYNLISYHFEDSGDSDSEYSLPDDFSTAPILQPHCRNELYTEERKREKVV